jgi:hypothetical protein
MCLSNLAGVDNQHRLCVKNNYIFDHSFLHMYHVWLALERMGRTPSLKISCCNPKRITTYRNRYTSLSALEVHTVGKIQHLLTLCTQKMKVAEQLFMLSIMLEFDDN